jgi:hypothetical protein
MITIQTYWQFLPHWAGPIIINNFHKAAKYFQFNITDFYIYPHLIAVKTDLSWDNMGEGNFSIDFTQTLVERKIPANPDFLDNLKNNLKDQTIIIEGDNYKIVKKYSNFFDLIKAIVDYTLTVDVSYPKNIGWSNIGTYTCPRPATGYGYSCNNRDPIIIQGHCFPIKKYYDFSWDHLENPDQRLKNFNSLLSSIKNFSLSMDEQNMFINTLYNPYPIVVKITSQLPYEIITSCLKNHNNAYLIEENLEKKAVVFIHFKGGNLDHITKGYEDTIHIRLQETQYYYSMDQQQPSDYWDKALENIMFFEDKIHMGHKKNTIDKLLKYLFKLKNLTYENRQLHCYLWDLNSRVVQELNDLQGFMSSHLFNFSSQDKDTIYNFYIKNTHHQEANLLTMAHGIFDSMMTLALGGIMTPHKDPYNLKGTIDEWLNLLLQEAITIPYQDLIDIFEGDYKEKFFLKNFWKNTIAAIESRWCLMFKTMPSQGNIPIIGHDRAQEIKFFQSMDQFDGLKKRLKGLLKKNNEEVKEQLSGVDDGILMEKVNILNNLDTYEKKYQWFQQNQEFLLKFLDAYKVKGSAHREAAMELIIKAME